MDWILKNNVKVSRQLIHTAWGGAGVFLIFVYLTPGAWAIASMVIWWLVFEVLAHLLLAVEDVPAPRQRRRARARGR